VFCGAERIVIGFYAGNAAGRMSMALNSIKFFKSATSMQSVGVVDCDPFTNPLSYQQVSALRAAAVLADSALRLIFLYGKIGY